jgi:hypothetical protein
MLVGAVASARAGERAEATAFLRHADRQAEHVGGDKNFAWTSFGPTNVALHRITVAAELSDPIAVCRGEAIMTSALPRERQARHKLELSRALFEVGRPIDAATQLLGADALASELVRRHFIARDLIIRWMRSRTRPNAELIALARRLGHSA